MLDSAEYAGSLHSCVITLCFQDLDTRSLPGSDQASATARSDKTRSGRSSVSQKARDLGPSVGSD